MPTKKFPTKKLPTKKRPAARLETIDEHKRSPVQQSLVDAIASGPRGKFNNSGPFAIWLHAPEFGMPAQQLGGHARLNTSVPPRLSEFAVLVTAKFWRSHYEWFVHAPIAEKAGVNPQTIADLRTGRSLKSASKEERAVYDFMKELYKTRRVSDRTYKRLRDVLGSEKTLVEFVGIIGYYVMVAMSLNVFRMLPPEDSALPFGTEK
jgi:4-carboxymuconolactone decarboxylase